MEVTSREKPVWLNESHPNYKRWLKARELSESRGDFVRSIIENFVVCENLNILDLGSGEGGTAWLLAKNNSVISFDISTERLYKQKQNGTAAYLIRGNAQRLPFRNNYFDLIILQDVIEHVQNRQRLVQNILNVLQPGGIIYLSTPNKYSFINLLADPHWGMPLISLMKREQIRNIFLKHFRKSEYHRTDIAELLSLDDIKELLGDKFIFNLNTKHSVKKLFEGDKGVAWSNFHLIIIRIIKFFGAHKIILKIANDKDGIVNNFFTPTFYIVLKKKTDKTFFDLNNQ